MWYDQLESEIKVFLFTLFYKLFVGRVGERERESSVYNGCRRRLNGKPLSDAKANIY